MDLGLDALFSVAGKTALITGGSSGIGRMIAEGLCRNGARVYIASRKLSACEAAAAELSALGACYPLAVDLGDQSSLQALADQFAARESRLHILINNAGAGWSQPIDDYPDSGWDKVMTLNVKAPFFLTKALLPQLRAAASAADPARVINIGSVSGIRPSATNNYAYGTSKAAVHHLTGNLAHTLAAEHITVNAISPGPFPSRMMGGQLDSMVKAVPLARPGGPEDAAGAAIFLCSRAGAYVTGAVVPVDGGLSA